ncbi:hypothetical protein KY284_012778 [Solanum tuberosum]|nr:hypothetical protein KY284_012778 [Solanum tuberosum]
MASSWMMLSNTKVSDDLQTKSANESVISAFCRVYWLTLSFTLKWDFSLVPPSASSHSRCAFPAPPSTDFRFLSSQVHIARNALAARIPIKYLAKILCGSSFSFLSFSMCFPAPPSTDFSMNDLLR